ncbi:MAG: hypothetical protein ACJASZ_000839 [Yoonia sp.]|jgi:hypothetical protein
MLAILGWMGMAVSAFLFVDMDDALLGSLGNDVLVGGAGADMMHGGSGNDILYDQGNQDRDFLNGGEGELGRCGLCCSLTKSFSFIGNPPTATHLRKALPCTDPPWAFLDDIPDCAIHP